MMNTLGGENMAPVNTLHDGDSKHNAEDAAGTTADQIGDPMKDQTISHSSGCCCQLANKQSKHVSSVPLWLAFGALILAGGATWNWATTNTAVIFFLIAGNTVAQMAIDFYKGERKPVYSAVARLIPLVIAAMSAKPL